MLKWVNTRERRHDLYDDGYHVGCIYMSPRGIKPVSYFACLMVLIADARQNNVFMPWRREQTEWRKLANAKEYVERNYAQFLQHVKNLGWDFV